MAQAGEIRYRGAAVVSSVFKVLVAFTITGGLILTIAAGVSAEHDVDAGTASSDTVVIAIAASVVSTMVTASLFAFFAYVLDLLLGIYDEVRSRPAVRAPAPPATSSGRIVSGPPIGRRPPQSIVLAITGVVVLCVFAAMAAWLLARGA